MEKCLLNPCVCFYLCAELLCSGRCIMNNLRQQQLQALLFVFSKTQCMFNIINVHIVRNVNSHLNIDQNYTMLYCRSHKIRNSFARSGLVSIVSSAFWFLAVIVVLLHVTPALCATSEGLDFLVHFVQLRGPVGAL